MLAARLLRVLLLAAWIWAPQIPAVGQALVVGSKPNVPPYEYLDPRGELDGFCVEVLRTVARRQGLALEFQQLSNQEVWDSFDQRRIDIISAAVYTEERSRVMDFTVPLAELSYVLLVRKGNDGIRSERDLQGKQVLVVERSHMAAYAQSRGLATKGFADYESCLAALAAGAGEAALAPRFTWMHLSQRRPLAGLAAVPTEIYPHRVCFAVQKGRSQLLAKLNEGVFELKNSGKLDEIYDRHLGSLERSQLPLQKALRRLAAYLLPMLLGLGLLAPLAWIFALRRQVRLRTEDLRQELTRRTEAEAELGLTVEQLRQALAEVKQLSGLLPICSGCKKIRDEGDRWQPLESYLSANSEATFSHGMCPECVKTLYPEYARGKESQER